MANLAQVNIGENFIGSGHPFTQLTGVGNLISIILKAAISLAGILLLILLIVGGIGMIAGAGANNPEQAAKGRQAATAAAIGFVIVFSAYWIVKLIETITGLTLL
jgi:hypothetical protein